MPLNTGRFASVHPADHAISRGSAPGARSTFGSLHIQQISSHREFKISGRFGITSVIGVEFQPTGFAGLVVMHEFVGCDRRTGQGRLVIRIPVVKRETHRRIRIVPVRAVYRPTVKRLIEHIVNRSVAPFAMPTFSAAAVAAAIQFRTRRHASVQSPRSGIPCAHRTVRICDHRSRITEIVVRRRVDYRPAIGNDRYPRFDHLFRAGILIRDRTRIGHTITATHLYQQQRNRRQLCNVS